jgi:hypothetical protein
VPCWRGLKTSRLAEVGITTPACTADPDAPVGWRGGATVRGLAALPVLP